MIEAYARAQRKDVPKEWVSHHFSTFVQRTKEMEEPLGGKNKGNRRIQTFRSHENDKFCSLAHSLLELFFQSHYAQFGGC